MFGAAAAAGLRVPRRGQPDRRRARAARPRARARPRRRRPPAPGILPATRPAGTRRHVLSHPDRAPHRVHAAVSAHQRLNKRKN